MKINTRLYFTSYLVMAFSLVTVMTLIGTATTAPQDSPTNSFLFVDTGHIIHGNVFATAGSNSMPNSTIGDSSEGHIIHGNVFATAGSNSVPNSTIGDSSEIDLNLLQILTTPEA